MKHITWQPPASVEKRHGIDLVGFDALGNRYEVESETSRGASWHTVYLRPRSGSFGGGVREAIGTRGTLGLVKALAEQTAAEIASPAVYRDAPRGPERSPGPRKGTRRNPSKGGARAARPVRDSAKRNPFDGYYLAYRGPDDPEERHMFLGESEAFARKRFDDVTVGPSARYYYAPEKGFWVFLRHTSSPANILTSFPKVEVKRKHAAKRNPTKPAIPGIAAWAVYAGGTGAAEGKHAYSFTAPDGRRYSISPFTTRYGRHAGYILTVFPSRTGGHGWIKLDGSENANGNGSHRSPQAAVTAARLHYAGGELTRQNPVVRRYKTVGEMRRAGVPDILPGTSTLIYESGRTAPLTGHSGHFLSAGTHSTALMRRRQVGDEGEFSVVGRHNDWGERVRAHRNPRRVPTLPVKVGTWTIAWFDSAKPWRGLSLWNRTHSCHATIYRTGDAAGSVAFDWPERIPEAVKARVRSLGRALLPVVQASYETP